MTEYTIKKIQKPVPTEFIKIQDKELHADTVLSILETVMENPVRKYQVDQTVANALVELGYLCTRYGTRQARLYCVNNKAMCSQLHMFLLSDEPTLYVKNSTP